jgi:hypothetical protein
MADQDDLKAATEAAVANFTLERVLNQGIYLLHLISPHSTLSLSLASHN